MNTLVRSAARLCLFAQTSRRFFYGACALALLATAIFAAWIAFDLGGDRVTTAVDDYGETAAALLAAAGCGAAAYANRGRSRLGWVLLALMAASWGAGEVVWTFYEVGLGRPVPNPSLADLGFLGAVPFGIVGLIYFAVPPRRPTERTRAIVDGLVIACSLFFVSWETVLGPIHRTSTISSVGEVTTLLYPIGDVAMLTLAAFALTRVAAGYRAAVVLLGAGIVGLSVADSTYAYLSATASYRGNALDAGWVGGFLLIFLGSLRSRSDNPHREALDAAVSRVRVAIPNLAFTFALLAGAAVLLSGRTLDRVALSFALLIAVFTLASHLLTLAQNRALLERSIANELALLDSRRALAQVIDSAPVILFSVNREGVLTLVTGNGLSAFGERAKNLAGRSFREVLSAAPAFVAAIEAAMDGRAAQLVQDFEHGDLDIRLLPVLDDLGNVTSVSGVAIDVSERRLAEAARRESEAKSRFLATMSHELRTPLNSVLGFAELLMGQRRGELNDVQKRYVGNISTSGNHLLTLINDVLDLTRVAAGEVEVNVRRVLMEEIIAEAVTKIRPLSDHGQLLLSARCDSSLEVLADPVRLLQIVLNLLSNAVKFTPEGGEVEIKASREGGLVEVAVRDSGIGIARENLDRIFEEYTRLHAELPGTGLGLTVSRRLATLMDGSLRVESVLGKGSVFRLCLPGAPVARPEAAPGNGRRRGRAKRSTAEVAAEPVET